LSSGEIGLGRMNDDPDHPQPSQVSPVLEFHQHTGKGVLRTVSLLSSIGLVDEPLPSVFFRQQSARAGVDQRVRPNAVIGFEDQNRRIGPLRQTDENAFQG
jgi:hypothetical protein